MPDIEEGDARRDGEPLERIAVVLLHVGGRRAASARSRPSAAAPARVVLQRPRAAAGRGRSRARTKRCRDFAGSGRCAAAPNSNSRDGDGGDDAFDRRRRRSASTAAAARRARLKLRGAQPRWTSTARPEAVERERRDDEEADLAVHLPVVEEDGPLGEPAAAQHDAAIVLRLGVGRRARQRRGVERRLARARLEAAPASAILLGGAIELPEAEAGGERDAASAASSTTSSAPAAPRAGRGGERRGCS